MNTIHFSIDDIGKSLRYLNNVNSIYNMRIFLFLHRLNIEHNIKVTLYCFVYVDDFCICEIPKPCIRQFAENAQWLSFGFHSNHKDMLTRKPLTGGDFNLSIHRDGRCDFTLHCPNCYSAVVYKNMALDNLKGNLTTNAYLGCPHCGQRLWWRMADIFHDIGFTGHFCRLLGQDYYRKYCGKRAIIWGCGFFTICLLAQSEHCRSLVIRIVDISYEAFKEITYCGLPVESPDVLLQTDFDVVFTPIVERRNEIETTLSNWGIKAQIVSI